MKLLVFSWFLFLFTFTGCNMGEHVNLSGYLIYSGGGKRIEVIDLDSMESHVLYESTHNVASIEKLTKVTSNKFMFEEGPITEPFTIKEYDMKNRASVTLRKGRLPTYIPESNNVFFYDYSKDSKEKWLFVSVLDAMGTARKVTKAPLPKRLPNGILYSLLTPVVQISPDEVALVGDDEQLWIYQISESNLKPTGIKHSFPKMWRSQTQQLICYDWELNEYYQVDLKTKQREELPQLKGFHGLTYIPKHDVLVFEKGGWQFPIAERHDIYAYSFKNQKRVKLKSHASISSGIWFEALPKP